MRATLRGLLDPAVNPQGTLHGATILVVGGGAGADLPHWRALRGARLVVWEPQPNFADALRRNLNTHEGESVVIAAVAPVAGEITLRVLNNPRESGIQPPTRLLDYQPRLSWVCDLTVPAQTLTQAVEPLQLAHDMPHLLVLDAPGQAGAILQSGTAALQNFTWLALRVGSQALYEEDVHGDEVCDLLQHAGFDLVADDLDVLPPHREMLWRRNSLKLEVLQWQRQHDAAVAELAEVRAELLLKNTEVVQLSTQATALLQENQQCQSELQITTSAHQVSEDARQAAVDLAAAREGKLNSAQAALAVHQAELTQQAAELARWRALTEQQQHQIDAMVQAQAAAEHSAAERLAQIDALGEDKAQLTAARDEQIALAAEQHVQIEQLTTAKAAAEHSAAERAQHIEALLQAQAAAEQTVAERQVQIDSLSRDKAQLTRARDEQTKLATDRQAQVESLTKARAAAEQIAAERAKQIDVLQQAKAAADRNVEAQATQAELLATEKAQLLTNREALAKDKADLERQLQAQTKATLELTQLLKVTETDNGDLMKRQHLLSEELLRAEVQIELIKDLLLREPGL